MTRAVIFDVGGVLARDIWEYLFDDLAADHRLDREALHAAGRLLWETFAYVPETPANTWRDMERRYWELFLSMFPQLRSRNVSLESLVALTDRYVVPVEGMRPILEALRERGIPLVVCSNNNEIWWPRQAEKLELARFFPESKLVLSSRVGAPKNSPGLEMFKAAVAAAAVAPGDCFFVDDRMENIERARSFGIDAVLFRGAAALRAELQQRGLALPSP